MGGWPSSRSTYWQAGSLLVAGASGCRMSPLLPAGAPACLLNPPACPPSPATHLQVYILGRGNVKPADKRYSRVRNDYALHFDPACEMDSCGALRCAGHAAARCARWAACCAHAAAAAAASQCADAGCPGLPGHAPHALTCNLLSTACLPTCPALPAPACSRRHRHQQDAGQDGVCAHRAAGCLCGQEGGRGGGLEAGGAAGGLGCAAAGVHRCCWLLGWPCAGFSPSPRG